MTDPSNNSPSASFGTLAGLKIVDLTRVLGGPYCTQILADHGANVIKIEPPAGDEVRDWGPPFHDDDAGYFIGVNRNKRSMGLDLSRPKGREVLLRLLEDADVLIENYKPGSMEKWGLGYKEVLRVRYPSLIHSRISGFGSDGPYGGYPGYDAIVQAMTGMFSVNGTSTSGPTRLGVAMVDMGTGLYAAIAILMAIYERQRSGHGQFIDLTLYDSAISLMHPHVQNYVLSGQTPGRTGNAHPNISPYDSYPTATVDVFIGCGNNRAFARLCKELGVPDLANDPRFLNNSDRVENREALTKVLCHALANVDGDDLCDRLLASGLPAGPIRDTQQMFDHPHTRHREMRQRLDWYEGTGTPIKFSRTPGGIRRPPPGYGAHSEEILRQHGFDDAEIKRLTESGVVLRRRR